MSTRCCRRGYSLIEMLIVISLLGVILGLATTMLGASFRMQTRATDRHDFDRSMEQFARRLRADAHAAESVNVGEDAKGGSAINLRMPDGRMVVYGALEGEVQRRVEREGEAEHTDRFRLPGCEVRFDLEKSESGDSPAEIVVASFSLKDAHPSSNTLNRLPIHAAVSLHRSPGPAEGEQ